MTTGLLNPTHIAILLLVVLIVLGPKKLPDTGRALGRSMREFRDGITGREPAPTTDTAAQETAGTVPLATAPDHTDRSAAR